MMKFEELLRETYTHSITGITKKRFPCPVDLDPDTELFPAFSLGNCKGALGRNQMFYRIGGTDDALVTGRIPFEPDQYWMEVRKGVFSARKEYGRRANRLAKKYSVPFEISCALGADENLVWAFARLTETPLDIELRYELTCGIDRRKWALREICDRAVALSQISWEQGEALKEQIKSLGQRHSTTLADFFSDGRYFYQENGEVYAE